jgi:glutathione S-transferase
LTVLEHFATPIGSSIEKLASIGLGTGHKVQCRDMRALQAPGASGEESGGDAAADWLDDALGAGDLLMVTALRRLNSSGRRDEFPNLSAYVARGETRPAYNRAFDDQLAVLTGTPPAD